MDLASYSDRPPAEPTRVLFLHGEPGEERLADEGRASPGARTRYATHPAGGHLRYRLETLGYQVHEAAEGCTVLPSTEIFEWPRVVREHLDRILHTDRDDATYVDGSTNHVLVFEPSPTSHMLVEHGVDPGDPDGPVLTTANVKAVVRSLFALFAGHPSVLFVYVVPPPLSPEAPPVSVMTRIGRALLSDPGDRDPRPLAGELSAELARWLSAREGAWKGLPANVAIFDAYGVLVDPKTGLSRYASTPTDDRPNADGNRRISEAFVPFLARAISRARGEP